MGRLRRLRFATALGIVGATAALFAAAAPAAQAAAAPRTCTVSTLRAVTSIWTITCSQPTVVTIDTDANAMNSAYPPVSQHFTNTDQQTVSPKSPWHDGMLFPASWYIYHVCTTISANGATIGSACFDRSSTQTGPCGVETLGGLNPTWAFGCPGAASNISVDVSYHYTRPGHSTVYSGHQVFTYAVAQTQMVEDGFNPPNNVTVADSTVTVTDTNTGQTLGTASFTR